MFISIEAMKTLKNNVRNLALTQARLLNLRLDQVLDTIIRLAEEIKEEEIKQ